jgi:two-component system response regulator YesN
MSRENSLDELCALLQNVVESFVDATFNRHDQGNLHIRRALQYIAANYMEHLTLDIVAEQAGLSPSHFSMLFTKIVGKHFRDYLTYVRVEESKRLLQSTDYPLAQIAAAVGFSDQSSFCKVFKREVGISPGKYRN